MRAHIAFFLPLCVLWSCSVVNGQWASLLRGKKEETGTAALDSTSNEPQLVRLSIYNGIFVAQQKDIKFSQLFSFLLLFIDIVPCVKH